MIPAMITVTFLVIVTILIHYEVLRITSDHLSEIPIAPRARIIVVVIAVFAAHTVEVWIYGLAYWLFIKVFGLGGFGGQPVAGFEDSLYFSAVTLHLAQPRRLLPDAAPSPHRRRRGAERPGAHRLVGLLHLSHDGAVLAAPSPASGTRVIPRREALRRLPNALVTAS